MTGLDFDIGQARSRINGVMMQSYVGRPVLLLGHFVSLDAGGKQLKLKTTDDHFILVELLQGPHGGGPMEPGCLLEASGVPANKNKLRCHQLVVQPFAASASGAELDRELYNEYVAAAAENADQLDLGDLQVHFGQGQQDAQQQPAVLEDDVTFDMGGSDGQQQQGGSDGQPPSSQTQQQPQGFYEQL
ncbi:hypothetical protein HDE_12618 [Halotydeus destructor]|nr:hypothetical protein HDE_12618 [Halotydeus destructor]